MKPRTSVFTVGRSLAGVEAVASRRGELAVDLQAPPGEQSTRRGSEDGPGPRPGLVAALLLALIPSLARGHDAGISYGELVILGDRVEASLRISAAELSASLALDAGGILARRTLAPGGTTGSPHELGPEVVRESLGTFSIAQGGVPCRFEPGAARPEPPDGVRVTGVFLCERPGQPLGVQVGLLERMPRGHTHLAKVTVGTRVEEHVVRAGRDTFEVEAPRSWWTGAARFLWFGLEHIFTGYDHIAFLLGLLLLGGTLGGLARVVTSFTAAHSVTLALASLGIVSLPSRLVEPLIAASIVCVAVENLLQLRRPSPRGEARRWRLGFAFGLVHGFGFAGALSELHLSRAGLATALLSFNVGVEVGQAAIVALAFPLLGLLRRRPALARVGLGVGSLAIGAAGVVWLAERLSWQ
jgi:hydrogenase/urease accessory protein HupE